MSWSPPQWLPRWLLIVVQLGKIEYSLSVRTRLACHMHIIIRMYQYLYLCDVRTIHVIGVAGIASVSSQDPILCRQADELKFILRDYATDSLLPCPDMDHNCTWYHVVNNVSIPLEERFLTSDGSGEANLLANDSFAYGKFIARTTSSSVCYQVCPAVAGNILPVYHR